MYRILTWIPWGIPHGPEVSAIRALILSVWIRFFARHFSKFSLFSPLLVMLKKRFSPIAVDRVCFINIDRVYLLFQLDRERAQSFCGNGVRWREVAWSQGDIVHHNRPWAFLVFPRKTADAQGHIFAAQIFRRRFWGLLVYLQDYFSWNCLPVFCVVCFCDTCIFVRGSRPSSSGFFHSLPRNDGPSRTCKNLWHPYQHHDRR